LPHANGGLQLADGAVADQFADAVEVRVGVALHAHLGGELAFFGEPVGAHDAGFLHGDGEGFLAIDVQAAVERPVGDEGVVVVRVQMTIASRSFCSRHLRQSV
jgi:hypothetical protein